MGCQTANTAVTYLSNVSVDFVLMEFSMLLGLARLIDVILIVIFNAYCQSNIQGFFHNLCDI